MIHSATDRLWIELMIWFETACESIFCLKLDDDLLLPAIAGEADKIWCQRAAPPHLMRIWTSAWKLGLACQEQVTWMVWPHWPALDHVVLIRSDYISAISLANRLFGEIWRYPGMESQFGSSKAQYVAKGSRQATVKSSKVKRLYLYSLSTYSLPLWEHFPGLM